MTVKDIKLKYCVGVLPINIVFAHNAEENAERLNAAYNCKGSEKIVSEKTGKEGVSLCGILCNGDSIKKDLTPEERVSQEIKEIIKENAKVTNNDRLIAETGNGLEATGGLLDKIKSDFKDNTLLIEINIGDQYLYFFTKEGLKTKDFVKISDCNECRDIVSKNFKDILKNRNQFKVTVEGDNVIIESKKESNGSGFMNDFNNDKDINSDENTGVKPFDSYEENPAVLDNSSNMIGNNNQLGLEKERNGKDLGNKCNDIMSENVDINPENTSFNSKNPADFRNNVPFNDDNNISGKADIGSNDSLYNNDISEMDGSRSKVSSDENNISDAAGCGSGNNYFNSGNYGITEKS